MCRATAASRSFTGPATGETVTQLRKRLRDWLSDTVSVGAERSCDIVLAASEALSNCAEHAYRGRRAGTMTLTIIYDPARAALELITSDDGQWIEPATPTPGPVRGRGLPLIKALSDACEVAGHPRGTTVRMQFGNCLAKDQPLAQAR